MRRVRNGERDLSVLVDRYKRGIASFISAESEVPQTLPISQQTFLRAYASGHV